MVGGSWKVEGRKQRQWKRRWNWGIVEEWGAKKGVSEGSSSKVREQKSPEQPLAPLPFMALVDNTYQSAVTGFCLHTQRGIPQCPGCFLCTAAKPRVPVKVPELHIVNVWLSVTSGYL